MAKKEHVKKIRKSDFNRQRAETKVLRDNCTTGYIFTHSGGAAGQSQFHHIICITSLQDPQIAPANKLSFFHDCMAVTKWDTNDSPNLIGLPSRQPYAHADRMGNTVVAAIQDNLPGLSNLDAQGGLFGSLPDLPCHSNEHPAYTEEVTADLVKNVWRPLAKEAKNCEISGQSIQGQLESTSFQWRQFLVGRGREHDGAAHCWRNRNEEGYKNIWYIPFSMNPGTPTKILAPPDYYSRRSNVKQWLKILFGLIT